jgi:tripartite-type tricarboxylate transporter receptor subunit TctC
LAIAAVYLPKILEEDPAMKLFALAVGLIAAFTASAQDYPNKPVKLIVPYAAGGLPDTMARVLSTKMSESLGQQLLVENRPGAGGITGTEAVTKADRDGYTLLIADVGQMAINPHLFSKLPYDPLKDLAPVTLLGSTALFLVVHPSVPVNNFKELVAVVKAKPGSLSYGSSGLGSIHHITGEAMKSAFGLDILHVPYKGMGQAVPALLGNQVSMIFTALPAIEGHYKSGKAKILAISTAKRSASTPDVPTVAELGAAGFNFSPEIGLLAPAGTPGPIVQKLYNEAAKALRTPEISQRYQQLGIDPVGNTPEAYSAQIRNDYERYGQVIRAAKIKID